MALSRPRLLSGRGMLPAEMRARLGNGVAKHRTFAALPGTDSQNARGVAFLFLDSLPDTYKEHQNN